MICRLCLSCEGTMNSILDMRLQLHHKIQTIADVQIHMNDELPATVCKSCTDKVDSFYNFKKVIETSNNTLKQWVQDNLPKNVAQQRQQQVLNASAGTSDTEMLSFTEPTMYNEQIEVAPRIIEIVSSEETGSSQVGNYICLICLHKFTEKGAVTLAHAKSHLSNKGKFQNRPPFKCELCSEIFNARINFVVHQRGHLKVKPYRCTKCKKDFGNTELIQQHINETINCDKEEMCSCEYCGRLYRMERDLIAHKKVHLQLKKMTCTLCQKSLSNMFTYNAHMKYHTNGKNHTCNICNKSYYTQSHLKRHQSCHEVNKPYLCSLCAKSFSCSSELNRHLSYHNKTKNHQCIYCKALFYENHHLQEHVNTIHLNVATFVCELCGKLFFSKLGLKKHLVNHPVVLPAESQVTAYESSSPDYQYENQLRNEIECEDYLSFESGELISDVALVTRTEDSLTDEVGNVSENVTTYTAPSSVVFCPSSFVVRDVETIKYFE